MLNRATSTPPGEPAELPGPGMFALTPADSLTPAEQTRIAELAALDIEAFTAAVDDYVLELRHDEMRVFWSPTLADRTAQALGELVARYNLRLRAEGPHAVTDPRTRGYLEEAIARVATHSKYLQEAIRKARLDGPRRRQLINRITADVHRATARAAARMIDEGHERADIVERLRADSGQPEAAPYLARLDEAAPRDERGPTRREIAAVVYEVEPKVRRRARDLLAAGHSIPAAAAILLEERRERIAQTSEENKRRRKERKGLRQEVARLQRRLKEAERALNAYRDPAPRGTPRPPYRR